MTDVHANVHLYVVDALTDVELREFETHLSTCADCQAEVVALREVAAALSEDAASEPPTSLRTSVLAEIATTPQLEEGSSDAGPAEDVRVETGSARGVSDEGGSVDSGTSRDDRTGEAAAEVVALAPRRRTRVPYLVAAAAVVAAVGFGGWAWQSRQDAQDAESQTAALTELLSADDVQTVSGTNPGGGSATVVMSASRGEAMFMASDLPEPPEGKVYELWTITDEPVPAGTFTPEGSQVLVALPEAATEASTIAVTIEPTGGSDQPTSDPIMTMEMS